MGFLLSGNTVTVLRSFVIFADLFLSAENSVFYMLGFG
tara:strand:+ start:2079 stop:2192 length:114 start_codon:yes stop_codon:yes gene_type:complete